MSTASNSLDIVPCGMIHTRAFGPVQVIERSPVRECSPKPRRRLVRIRCEDYPYGVWVRWGRIARKGGAR